MFTSLRRGQLGCKLSAPHFLQIVKGLTKGYNNMLFKCMCIHTCNHAVIINNNAGAGLPHWNEYGTHSMRHSAAYFASWIGIPPETIRVSYTSSNLKVVLH